MERALGGGNIEREPMGTPMTRCPPPPVLRGVGSHNTKITVLVLLELFIASPSGVPSSTMMTSFDVFDST
jgi:hypothetical protein